MFSVNLVSCNSAQNLLLGLWKSILYFFSGLVTIRSITKVLLFHRWQSLWQHMKCFNQSIYHNTRDCIKWLIIYKEIFKKEKESLWLFPEHSSVVVQGEGVRRFAGNLLDHEVETNTEQSLFDIWHKTTLSTVG